MRKVNLAQAKAQLSELVEAAVHGEEIVIARRNRPLVRLAAISPRGARPLFGRFRGLIELGVDFDEPLDAFGEYVPRKPPKMRR